MTSSQQQPACHRCGGLHLFDTSIPSVAWNRVVRERGLPDFLCLSCIVEVFAAAGQSFTATLWGRALNGCPIEVRIRGQEAQDDEPDPCEGCGRAFADDEMTMTTADEVKLCLPCYGELVNAVQGAPKDETP